MIHHFHTPRPLLVIAATVGAITPLAATAQTTLDYTATAETAFGSGSFTPYFLSSNRHGILSTKPNTSYVRYALTSSHTLRQGLSLDGAFDLQLSDHDYQTLYLQQLYVGLQWQWLRLEAGTREYDPHIRNRALSSGSTIWSGNARPIPQVRLSTVDYVTLPGTHGWLQLYFDGSYGRFIDTDYQEDRYAEYTALQPTYTASRFLTTDVWYHQKRIFFRTDPKRRFSLTAGMEHAVQFGGRTNVPSELQEGETTHKFTPKAKDFFKVLWPSSGDAESAGGDRNFVYGNHLGNIQFTLDYHPNATHTLSAYVEDLFEDGSGMAKRNGWDGLWGLEYKAPEGRWLTGVVLEYLQTSDQSGPIHYAPSDFTDDAHAAVTAQARGADDYYNNYFYNGYTHYGMSLGSPLLMSPRYNLDGYLRFTDTRVRAYHIGVSGAPFARWEYRLLVSYRESWGTPFVPSEVTHHSFNTLLEATYRWSRWRLTAAYALDRGNLYGDNAAFNVRISHSGHLLSK
jgi:hypothetical protein